ncbi:MAG: P-type superfamily ATPase, Ca2+-transporting ATPase [Candidatus Saccharibacteria bacterium]|nr:P-type superfamily ATPase, Ca2+-transporting ATPase [Candidatus Saccharibacteria bacterium]
MPVDYKSLNYYRLKPDEVLKQLDSNAKGLSHKQATERLSRLGANTLERTKRDSTLTVFIRQFKNILVIMLLVSSALAIYLKDGKTATILIVIAVINSLVGFMQENKAGNLMKSLERLMVPQAKVLRDGKIVAINSTELVLGDVIYIEQGDSVPADARILEEAELGTNDFALTGESSPSRKFVHAISGDVPLGNRHNLIFMGTTVATGTGYAVVVGTGMHSELGRIASLSQATHAEASPLQKEMNHLAIRIAQGTVILALFLIGVALHSQIDFKDAILFGVGISAAMIPTGLVAEVNITLAQAAGRLAKARALVKKLAAVETLGATNFILTDKTGTLTKNEMTVQQLMIGRTIYNVSGTGYEATGSITPENHKKPLDADALKKLELFFATGALASNAKVNPPDEEHPDWYVVGDPTEGALITLARKAGINIDTWEAEQPETKEFQFDSARKLLSSVRSHGNETVVYVKGAPENLLEHSTHIWDHGHIRKLSSGDRAFLLGYNEKQAKSALRNLGFGYRVLPAAQAKKKPVMDEVESDFVFLGMVSMLDPLRDAVPGAMTAARGAHVKVSIITGDYPTTAKAIAQKANLADDITIILGDELDKLADSQILQLVEHGGAVFSRVAPEDKLRIVSIVKASGHVVAVTGDGINDAPALKSANIGVAMGRTGTDVAKDAADIVLLDDSFDTLVGAIEEGRLTFQNIRKAARCALTTNAGELITVMAGLLGLAALHIEPAITPIQILAIDVVAQILPVTALGWDKPLANLMREKPRDLKDHIVNHRAVGGFLGFGLLAAVLAYGNYLEFFVRHHLSPMYIDHAVPLYQQATTLTYLTLVLCLYVYLLFERAETHGKFFTSYLWSNKQLLAAFAGSFFLIGNIMYNPWFQPYFSTHGLDAMDWLTAIACAAFYMVLRLSQRQTRKHTRRAVVELHRQVRGA